MLKITENKTKTSTIAKRNFFLCCTSSFVAAKNRSSVPMSAFSLNPETQSFIEEGGKGGYMWSFFLLTQFS